MAVQISKSGNTELEITVKGDISTEAELTNFEDRINDMVTKYSRSEQDKKTVAINFDISAIPQGYVMGYMIKTRNFCDAKKMNFYMTIPKGKKQLYDTFYECGADSILNIKQI